MVIRQTPDSEKRSTVPVEDIQYLLDAIRHGTISPIAEGPMVVDGTSYELTIHGDTTSCMYRWPEGVGAGWAGLSRIADEMIRLSGHVHGVYYW